MVPRMAEKTVKVNRKITIIRYLSTVLYGLMSPKPTDERVVKAK